MPITLPMREEPWGERLFMVQDPNGIVYELVEWAAADEPQACSVVNLDRSIGSESQCWSCMACGSPVSRRPGRLALWAEDPASAADHLFPCPAPAAPVRGAGRRAGRRPDRLVRRRPRRAGEGRPRGELTLHLPGTAKGPLPSPETGSEAPSRGLRLAAWETPALVLPGEQALAALGALAEPDPDGPWAAAASLRYLCVLAGHACDLARRGRMLPQLVIEAGVPAARWRPVLTGADAAAYRDFAAAMPPVCRRRRLAGPGTAGADTCPAPRGCCASALEALVDAAARAVMPERLLLGHRPGPEGAAGRPVGASR